MSPAEIIPKLLIVPAIFVGVMVVAIIAKLLWFRVILPKLAGKARRRKGGEGEQRVADALSVFTEADGYRLLRNLWLFYGRGNKTEIDLLLLSPYGIFVMEVKTLSGKIEVDPSDRVWIQHSGGREETIRSPRRENAKRIAALHEITGVPKEFFHSVVVMAGSAPITTEVPPGVYYLYEVREHIDSHKEKVLSGDTINGAINAVMANTNRGDRPN